LIFRILPVFTIFLFIQILVGRSYDLNKLTNRDTFFNYFPVL